MTVCRGIRGATVATDNSAPAIYDATREMLSKLIDANEIEEQDVAAAYFTMTPDLNACFPAAAARQLGWNNTALMGATEVDVPGSLTKCIRVYSGQSPGATHLQPPGRQIPRSPAVIHLLVSCAW